MIETEKPLRFEEVKPIESGAMLAVLPVNSLFRDLVDGQCGKIFLVGQMLGHYKYTEITTIAVYRVDLDAILGKPVENGIGTVTRTREAVKILSFRNKDDRKEQLKDFGRIIWLLEENINWRNRFCPKCSDPLPCRYSDIYTVCGICGSTLESEEFMPRRFRKRNHES